MKKEWNFKQELTAAFGQPIAENPTQYMIESAYKDKGLDWRYLSLEVGPADLADAVKGARAFGFRGFNCTIPHKVAVIEYLDGLGESAELMGAVNCIVRRGEKLIGENTDGKGFVQSLKQLTDPKGKNIVIFGAGGAARAITVETALAGASHISLVNRNTERGEALTELLNDKVKVDTEFFPWEGDFQIPENTDVVINATSIGLYPDVEARIPVNMDSITARMVVADVIPNPPKTRLVQEATAKGCQVIDGKGMLVNQGVIGFKYWTGVDPDPAVMHKALEDVFGV